MTKDAPDFHVTLTLEEYREEKRRKEEERLRKIREEQIRRATLFFVKFILPVIFILYGASTINQNGGVVLIIGILYLALMVYITLHYENPDLLIILIKDLHIKNGAIIHKTRNIR